MVGPGSVWLRANLPAIFACTHGPVRTRVAPVHKAMILFVALPLGLSATLPEAHAQSRSTARPVDDSPRQVPPDSFTPELPTPGAQRALAMTSAALFAAWYGGALGASLMFSDAPGARELRIPVAGPWMALPHAGCGDNRLCTSSDVAIRVVLTVVDGIGQLGALAFLAEAAFMPTRERDRLRLKSASPSFRAVPFVAGKEGMGLGVLGTF